MKATLIVVQNDAEHAEAKAFLEKLMGSSDSGDLARMTAQATLIEAYERVRWPRRPPTLPDLLKYLMDEHDLTRADLVPLLGTASRVGEVLNGKRELSMSMVRKLRERFHISADLLISPVRIRGMVVLGQFIEFR
jgi:HTH-type transcriptional regulator/antitoxin HigA